MAIYQHGRYAVTGQTGLYRMPKSYGLSYRVVNMETRKLASPEFRNVEEAKLHADSLVAARMVGRKKKR